jgi:hypothetical protein
MANQNYNPTHNPQPALYSGHYECALDGCPQCATATPGGTTNRVMWDEKGVLDNTVYRLAQAPKGASLPSSHDSHKQGIYTTNSVGDYD